MWGALSDERSGLQFSVAAGHRHCSPRILVLMDSWALSVFYRKREENVGVVMKDTTLGVGVRENIFSLEGYQAVPASPYGEGKEYDQN
jgi:hypothetical protein